MYTIYADPGPFESIEKAAHAEHELDWSEAIGDGHTACTVCFAAVELAEHLNQVQDNYAVLGKYNEADTNTPAIIIAAGGVTGPADEIEGAYKISSDEGRICITGSERMGALYGVYDFLRALGFDWFSPDPWDSEIPETLPETIHIEEQTSAPDFAVRGFCINADRGGNTFPLWMARNKLNQWSLEAPDLNFCRKLGLKSTGGWHEDLPRCLPANKYFDEHPEYFGLKDGKRSANLVSWEGVNPCFSNPETRRICGEGLVQSLIGGQSRNADTVFFATSDNGAWCECPECRVYGNPSDHALRMVYTYQQAIAEARAAGRLKRAVTVGMYAYVETIEPPTRAVPDGFDFNRSYVMFYPIERCYVHPFYADEQCAINKSLHNDFQKWRKQFPGLFGFGEYFNVSKFAGIAVLFMRIMDGDIPYLYEQGTRVFNYMHPVVSNLGMLAATNYQMAGQLWDHTESGMDIFHSFLAGRYGDCAEEMKQVYTLTEKAMCNSQAWKHIPNFNTRDHLFLTLQQPGNPEQPVDYFRSDHFKPVRDETMPPEAPSLQETRDLLKQALDILNSLEGEGQLKQRLESDRRRLQYTADMADFYWEIIHVRLAENEGDKAKAEEAAVRLNVIGEKLRQEDVVTADGCQDSDILFQNGLMATYLSQPYIQIMKTYGIEVEDVPFDGVV